MSLSNPLTNLLLLSFVLMLTFGLDVTKSAPVRTDLQKGSCYSMCDSRYSVAKTDSWSACHHGCRLLALLSQMADRKSRKQVKRSCLSGNCAKVQAKGLKRVLSIGLPQLAPKLTTSRHRRKPVALAALIRSGSRGGKLPTIGLSAQVRAGQRLQHRHRNPDPRARQVSLICGLSP